MDGLAVVAANIGGMALFIGGIALCVRFDQQGKSRRRELEHAERMRAIELGRPLEDAAVARYHALGAIGVAVPVSALSAAAIGSGFALAFQQPEWRFGALAVVWAVAGAATLAAVPAVLARLRERPPGG